MTIPMQHEHPQLEMVMNAEYGTTYYGCPRCKATVYDINSRGVGCVPPVFKPEPPQKQLDDWKLADFQRAVAKAFYPTRES